MERQTTPEPAPIQPTSEVNVVKNTSFKKPLTSAIVSKLVAAVKGLNTYQKVEFTCGCCAPKIFALCPKNDCTTPGNPTSKLC